MIKKLVEIFRSKEVRERIFFTLGIFLIFKIGTTLVVPGVDPSLIEFQEGDIFNLMNVLGGGSLLNFSVFAMGIAPYITSSIIIQLLSKMDVLPKLKELSKQGEKGRKKLNNATRYLTLVIAAVQGYGTFLLMQQSGLTSASGEPFAANFTEIGFIEIQIVLTLVAGTMFVVWLADRISSKGVGNGVSMMIAAGIISTMPFQFSEAFRSFTSVDGPSNVIVEGFLNYGLYVFAYLLFIIFVVFIEKSIRKVPLQQSQNTATTGKNMHHLPIKLNPAGVIPVIFASSFMMAIVTIASMFGTENETAMAATEIFNMSAQYNGIYWGLIIYVTLIILFTFFWANMQLDPNKISENLATSNSYIPGVRQGQETERYLTKIINRVSSVGALALAFVAASPILLTIIFNLGDEIAFGGTSLIIVVGVSIETYNQIKSRLAGKEYKGFVGR